MKIKNFETKRINLKQVDAIKGGTPLIAACALTIAYGNFFFKLGQDYAKNH